MAGVEQTGGRALRPCFKSADRGGAGWGHARTIGGQRHGAMRPWAMGSWSPGRKSDKVHGRPWDHGAMERHGAGRVEGAERAERAERRRGRR